MSTELGFDKYSAGPLVAGNGKALRTCQQYIEHVSGRVGDFGGSRMESGTEYAIYIPTCGTLFAVERASEPKRSFLGPNPLDFRILPPTRLPNGPTSDAQDELEEAFQRGQSAEDFLSALKEKDPQFDTAAYLEGWSVVLHVRGDFDGDGVEDALVTFSYSPTGPEYHYFGYGIGVLKRLSENGPAQWIEFRDFKWSASKNGVQRAPASVRRDAER